MSAMKNVFREIFALIEKAKKVLVISHVNPDGDTLGSACALRLAIGQKADVLVQNLKGDGVPDVYRFLPDIASAKTLRTVQDVYDLVITVDVASVDRITGVGRQIFDKCQNTVNIDHHKTNKGFAKLNAIVSNVSSCCELLYDIFVENNIKITKDIADCLYVGVLTDTGSFRYESVTPKTFQVASKLIEAGTDPSDIAQKCYENKSREMVLFQAYCVSKAEFLCHNRLCCATVQDVDMQKFGAKDEHTEGICETLRSISSVEVAFVMKEIDQNAVKVSLRSKELDVTQITARFNGGGHQRAAGCTINKPLKIAKELLIEEIKKYV